MALSCLWKTFEPGYQRFTITVSHSPIPLEVLSYPPVCSFLDPTLLSFSFSHSQTTLVLIKPRGLTFSPRYLECCTKSILRPCQPGNKPQLFPFWDFSTLVLLEVRNKLKLGFLAAQHCSYFLLLGLVK